MYSKEDSDSNSKSKSPFAKQNKIFVTPEKEGKMQENQNSPQYMQTTTSIHKMKCRTFRNMKTKILEVEWNEKQMDRGEFIQNN